ncbi:MAG: lipopolysaccharide biosynthesis protein [Fibrobacteres bacterium]|jgi:teichuronic acid exporter|nr:lipopolysaccharide biosynthesis protein [Fibrobacterota bacterium]
MSSHREKAIRGVSWSFIDNIGNKFLQFLVGIVMARLLSPHEYGVLGMVTVFVTFSHIFLDSGFSQSLVVRQDCKQEEFSTIFFFNLAMGVTLYGIFFVSAPLIASFFEVSEIVGLVRVYGIVLIINALSLVQRIQFAKLIDFKTQAFITLTSTVLSSALGLYLAWTGHGIWSLVIRMVVESAINTVLYWIFGNFRLLWVFDVKAFREMFAFGYKMLLSGLIDRGYDELYKVVIGKFFRIEDLGFYQRASQFSEIPSAGFTSIVQRVSAPLLAQMPQEKLKYAYSRLIKIITLVVFALMAGMAACAESLVAVLLGPKWAEVVPFLQLLCLATILYPLHALNLEIIWVRGFSGLFLRLEIIKKLIALPVILAGIFFGIHAMLWGMVGASVVAYFVNSFYSGKFVDYPVSEQLRDLAPNILVVSTMAGLVWLIGLAPFGAQLLLLLQVAGGVTVVVGLSELFKLEAYLEMKSILLTKMRARGTTP